MNRWADIYSRNIVLGRGLAPVPERLLLAHARGEVLFIAGAGVSRDAGLPNFRELVEKVYKKLDPVMYSVILNKNQAPPDLTDDQQAELNRFCKGEYDVVLGMLERRIEGQEEAQSLVRQKIGDILRPTGLKPAPIHRSLMRLSNRGGPVTIITTNFDLLLEEAARKIKIPIQMYALGGIPRPTLRSKFSGVLHIHGALDRNPQRMSDLIISDQDFGEFYLRRRIASDLIYDAARLYNLVLVGYSANDPPMRYLLSAVAADTTHFPDLKERFIFVGMSEDDPVEVELADWRARGITPIQYTIQGQDHSQLQRTLAQWAEFSMFNINTRALDSTLKRIVQSKRADASQDDRYLFDHFIRRSVIDLNERERLTALLADYQANFEWRKAALDVLGEESEESRR